MDHADKFHGGKILSACSHCKEVFDDEAEKKKHELEAHPDTETDGFWSEKKKIPCEFCGKVVMQKCMKAHIRYGRKSKFCSSHFFAMVSLIQVKLCSVLEKSHIGAKSDFEIWGFKGFFSLDPKKGPKEGL